MKEYNEDNLATDLTWFEGLGVDVAEAEEFIKHLLNSKWVE